MEENVMTRCWHLLLMVCAAVAPASAQSPTTVTGRVFVDRNGNGVRDAGEVGLGGVAVSNQDTVVRSAPDGTYRIAGRGTGLVFVSVPSGFRPSGPWWRATGDAGAMDFGLRRGGAGDVFTFIHASDTHIAEASKARTARLLAIADSVRPAFVLVTGDLVRDALRVGEGEATGYYEMFDAQLRGARWPVWTVPGNHEIFGIERERSGVSAEHPLFGRAMYRNYRGPDYYSFDAGGVHFVGLNTVDIDGPWYYGHVDSAQRAWLARDLAMVPARTPVVTFNHIPFYTALGVMSGYDDGPPAPDLITVAGRTSFRHAVSNAREVMEVLEGRLYPLALGGHVHAREELRYAGIPTRFEQGAAVVGANPAGGFSHPSGVTVYRVQRGRIGPGLFVPLGIP
jgi:hypothetical protein